MKHKENHFSLVVVGGGHAGVEAAYAAVKLKQKVALVTLDLSSVGRMSCNPAVGGIAKGQLVREMDVLGALMPRTTDTAGVQFKLLNLSKGRSVWSPRAQVDKRRYERCIKKALLGLSGLKIVGGEVINLFLNKNKLSGVLLRSGETLFAPSVVLTCGTFLGGLVHVGEKKTQAGRMGEHRAVGITESLTSLGLRSGRLKTGTPPRLYGPSVNWAKTVAVFGDTDPAPFSYSTKNFSPPNLPCHNIKTNQGCHDIIQKNLSRSPMFSGDVSGVGPRYCPSIEDKIYRFVKKKSHLLFLEPEWVSSDQIYVNGFSTSLPEKTQLSALRKIPALKNVEFLRPGYAIEYDFFPPAQLKASLESKEISGLFFAGQINGTSGYEEAAAQGLLAGINAAMHFMGREPLVLQRNEAYIGVLIDDLVTKETLEPYRMFTARAEYRLMLRHTNADLRLSPTSYKLGLLNDVFFNAVNKKLGFLSRGAKKLQQCRPNLEKINSFLSSLGEARTAEKISLADVLRRPSVSLRMLVEKGVVSLNFSGFSAEQQEDLLDELETSIKYEGYIKRQDSLIKRLAQNESAQIPPTFNFNECPALSSEAREKLGFVQPETLGQASRISGVSPADVGVLAVLLAAQ